MATAKKAPAKRKAPAKKAVARKAAPKKTVAKKAAPKKVVDFNLKASAEKAVNVYLGLVGKGLDMVEENMESARKDSEKRMSVLEKRGAKLRKELTKRVDSMDTPEFDLDNIVEDAKSQFNKVQDRVEEAVEEMKEKLTPAKAA
jgi:hypothetical protein